MNCKDNTISGVIDRVVTQGQEWRVRVHDCYWGAIAMQTIQLEPGDRVQILGRKEKSIKLLITKMPP
jgi:membrane protein implicated in regulation of membrane protease activity